MSKLPNQGGRAGLGTWFAQGWGGGRHAGSPERHGRLGGLVSPAAAAAGRLAPGRGAVVHQGGRRGRLSPGVLRLGVDVGHFSPARGYCTGRHGERERENKMKQRKETVISNPNNLRSSVLKRF